MLWGRLGVLLLLLEERSGLLHVHLPHDVIDAGSWHPGLLLGQLVLHLLDALVQPGDGVPDLLQVVAELGGAQNARLLAHS